MTAAITADFKTTPFLHQLKEFEYSADLPGRALLWQMRTGKTKLVIDTACHQFKELQVDAIIVFAPNGVHANWATREIPRHAWEIVEHDALVWQSEVASAASGNSLSQVKKAEWKDKHEAWWAKADRLIKNKSRSVLPWFCFSSATIGRPDIKKLLDRIRRNKKRVFIIFDESHEYRAPGSKRSKRARGFAKHCFSKRLLTGTVVENDPLAAWAQYELLQPAALGFKRFAEFDTKFAEYELKKSFGGRQYPVLKGYKHLDILRERMSKWSSVVLREDCQDLPALVRRHRTVSMSEEQQRLYNTLHHDFVVQLADDLEVSIGENSSKLIKLQQVSSGYLKDEFGDIHSITGPNPRLEALLDEVAMVGNQRFIVWCQFRHEIDEVAAALRARGLEVLEYHGRTSATDKELARWAFAPETEHTANGLVGQAQAGGSGLDFSAASVIIWYSHTFDAIVRGQADERATAIGGGNVQVVDLVASPTDKYILDNVLKKVSIAEVVSRSGMKEVLRRIAL